MAFHWPRTPVATIIEQLLQKEGELPELWRKYTLALERRASILSAQTRGLTKTQLEGLLQLTDTELANIEWEEATEEELIDFITKMEHDWKIKRIHRLERCLDYAQTQYDYAYELLKHLREALKHQGYILKKLLGKTKYTQKLVMLLRQHFELECELAAKIAKVKNFHQLWERLQQGEPTIRRLSEKQSKLKGRLWEINVSQTDRIGKRLLEEWGKAVFEAIEEQVEEGIEKGMLTYSPYIDFEFVNSPAFVELVRKKAYEIRGKEGTDTMITSFIYHFREWYNYHRD